VNFGLTFHHWNGYVIDERGSMACPIEQAGRDSEGPVFLASPGKWYCVARTRTWATPQNREYYDLNGFVGRYAVTSFVVPAGEELAVRLSYEMGRDPLASRARQ
jgi:hypothetical protein